MKKIVKFMAVLFAACTLMTTAASCKKKEPASGRNTEIVLNTVHGGKAERTGDYIVFGGASGYKLVKASDASLSENLAVSTFRDFFNRATGLNLPVVTDGEAAFTADSRLISFGSNNAATDAGIPADLSALTEGGFGIKTVGKSIFLYGGTDGIKYAAYELLSRLFGFEYYAENCYSLQTDVSELSLYDFDLKEIPDIQYRQLGTGAASPAYTKDKYYFNGLRMSSVENQRGLSDAYYHDSFLYLPVDPHYKAHPEWYSVNVPAPSTPYQLCYSAHGDAASLDLMVDAVAEKMKARILEKPEYTLFTIIHEDNNYWCECPSCAALKTKYNGNGASLVLFLNKLSDKITAWTEGADKPAGNRKIKVGGMAYLANEGAPVAYDEKTDTYSPIDESVKARDNVHMFFAPIKSPNYYLPFDHADNADVLKNLRGWAATVSGLRVWIYNQRNFNDFMSFYDNYSSMQQNYKIIVQNKGSWVFDQGQNLVPNSTAFNILRLYLSSKMAWNCQDDYDALLDNFFINYFGAANPAMRKLFEAFRNKWALYYAEGKISNSAYVFDSVEMLPYGFLKTLDGYIDEAYALIEPLKAGSPTAYAAIYDRINLESISIRYHLLQIYPLTFTDTQLRAERLQFKADCQSLKIIQYGEPRKFSMESVWASWGI